MELRRRFGGPALIEFEPPAVKRLRDELYPGRHALRGVGFEQFDDVGAQRGPAAGVPER